RLPRGEEVDAVVAEEGGEVVVQALGVGGRRDGDHVRPAVGRGHEAGHGEGPSGLGHGQERVRPPPNLEEGGVVAEQRGEIADAHRRTANATAAPSVLSAWVVARRPPTRSEQGRRQARYQIVQRVSAV